MTFNTTFAMTHFLKLCYNAFILENKIDARVFIRTCVNLCYILLRIALICVNLERGFLLVCDPSKVHFDLSKPIFVNFAERGVGYVPQGSH
jgi:hypothetical protein